MQFESLYARNYRNEFIIIVIYPDLVSHCLWIAVHGEISIIFPASGRKEL